MKVIQKFFRYINIFHKPNPEEPTSTNLKIMHGINRISILVFIGAVIFLIIKLVIL